MGTPRAGSTMGIKRLSQMVAKIYACLRLTGSYRAHILAIPISTFIKESVILLCLICRQGTFLII